MLPVPAAIAVAMDPLVVVDSADTAMYPFMIQTRPTRRAMMEVPAERWRGKSGLFRDRPSTRDACPIAPVNTAIAAHVPRQKAARYAAAGPRVSIIAGMTPKRWPLPLNPWTTPVISMARFPMPT